MTIITISRGVHSLGQEVAELVAQELGYPCLARNVILEASELYDVPEIKLVNAIANPPSVFDRLSRGKEGYVAYIQAALLKRFRADNLVYHGLLGHHFLPDVSHVLKVRILADTAQRIALAMKHDGVSEQDAKDILEKSDQGRRQWAMKLYGVDTCNPEIYDLTIHVGKVSTSHAADTICRFARFSSFQATPESQARVEDLALTSEVGATLLDSFPGSQVSSRDGDVVVTVPGPRVRGGTSSEFSTHYKQDLERRIHTLTLHVPGIKSLEVKVATDE